MFVRAKVVTLAPKIPRYPFTMTQSLSLVRTWFGAHGYSIGLAVRSPSSRPCITDCRQEAMRQFGDAVGLSPSNSLTRDQFAANSQSDCTSGNEAERGALIYPASSNQRNGGKHCLQIANVIGPSDMATRHNLDEVGIEFPGCDNPSWSQGSGNYDGILFHSKTHCLWVKTIAGKQLNSCVQALFRSF